MLLKITNLSKSTFFYRLNSINRINKDIHIEEKIKEIFSKNYSKYGSPRITLRLRQLGYKINHKKVERIMNKLGLSARPKRRCYHSYRGLVGKICKNLLIEKKIINNVLVYERNLKATRPFHILGTDITQFNIDGYKLYLSPIIDFYTREVLAYDLSEHPDYEQIKRMLNMLYAKYGEEIKGAILHSNQGYQYQMKAYQRNLKDHGLIQSMSRKGNCLDNSPTENFFGRLKTEMFYDNEFKFNSINELKEEIVKYIEYYNNRRLVTRLKTTPTNSRLTYNNV